MKAAMCYAYAGSFALGAEAWFEVMDHYEDPKPYGTATMLNRDPTRRIWNAETDEPYELVDAVFANPPCAPFSPAGYKAGKGSGAWEHDPRLICHESTTRIAAAADAAVCVIESVPQSVKAQDFFESLRERFLPNHKLTKVPHNAMHHGIPQNRPRVFWIYHTTELDIPEPTECRVLTPGDLNDPHGTPIRGMRDATKQILRKVPQGKALRPYWDHPAGVKGIPSTACRRLKWGSPTPSMSGVRGYVHPEEDRYITQNELLGLCGYPLDYPFTSTGGARVLEACRAVLPPVAHWISEIVWRSLR